MTTNLTLERLLESKLALIDELIEIKKPSRSSCINGESLRSAESSSASAPQRKKRTRAKKKTTRADGKTECQFGCGFSVADRSITDAGKSNAVATHHKHEHWHDMSEIVLEWANQGKSHLEIADLMIERFWVGVNTAPVWTAQMIQQLTLPNDLI